MAEEVHVHQAPSSGNGGGGPGWIVALLVVIILAAVLWFAFGRTTETTIVPDEIEADIDVNLPSG